MTARKQHTFFMFVDGLAVCGPIVHFPESGDVQDLVCQHCLTDTNKRIDYEIIEYGIIDDIHHISITCERCENTVVATFTLEHNTYGADDETITVKGN